MAFTAPRFLAVTLALCVATALAGTAVHFQPSTLGAHGEQLRVTMIVLSSTEDPTWTLTVDQSNQVRKLSKVYSTYSAFGSHKVLGYRGFAVAAPESRSSVFVSGSSRVELYLLSTIPEGVVSMEVVKHALERVSEDGSSQCADVAATCSQDSPCCNGLACVCTGMDCACKSENFERVMQESNDGKCATPIVGPDTAPVYDPSTDNKGCFVTDQSYNNCYNYGNDIVTDTFAQPGRGTGHKWTANTCEAVRTAAESDGLVWAGTDLPTDAPATGHFVALFIWPNTNFHWIRMDKSKEWSHKPGGTAVRNTDNTGKHISDPSKSDFSPWSQFCGYMSTVPSAVKID